MDLLTYLLTYLRTNTNGLSIDTVLDDLERRNIPYFAFFTAFDCFALQLRHSG